MKNFSQDELRKMYDTPPQELTSMIHETIASLPYRETEETTVKKKLSHVTVLAIVLILVLMATALAATSTTVNNLVYKVWPDLAEALMPVNLACEDQGIRLEVESAVIQGCEILVTYSLQDLKGDRIRSNADVSFITPELSDSLRFTGHGVTGETDPTTGKHFYAVRLEYDDEILSENGYISFSTNLLNCGSEEIACADLHPYLMQYGSQVPAMPVPDSLKRINGPYYEGNLPEGLQVIDNSRSLEIPLCDTVCLSGIGIIDGYLHVQIHHTDYQPLETKEFRANPYSSWVTAQDQDGNLLYSGDADDEAALSVLHWGGSDMMSEWTEYFFKITREEAENADLSVTVRKNLLPIVGNWKIKIPERMIRHSDQTEADEA